MRLTHDVFLEQQQKLLMTPELRQAIAILQMSTLELTEYIQRELEENPFLEEKEVEDPGDDQSSDEETDKTKMEEWLEYYNDRDIGGMPGEAQEEKSFDNFLSKRPSLYEHLEFQLRLVTTTPEDAVIGNYLIGSIDNSGYLCVDLNEVGSKVGCSLEKVEKVLKVIQSFHPHGVGARDLKECLLLQLKHFGKESPMARRIIENHLTDLARGRVTKIASALSISAQQVQGICDLIRTLDPKPGLQYSNSNEIRYILPDVFVEKVEGEYIVIVNDFNFPRLIINRVYEKVMRQPDAFPQDAKKYLEDKMGSAIWLIRSIEQRRMTLYKVARCIVDIQSEFLDQGIQLLKPLTLRQVAEIIDVHESTVSRATTNKFIQTPQGLFELKYFFSTAVDSCRGSKKVSAKSIKYMVEDIIANEDPTNPLSDESITQVLNQRNVRISRRTVAKYRQEMSILPAMARRRY
ncbi:MAG: RNA polymerase factor sigma-54 [Syntrophomonadaceae bacterium]|nr:RNA polymerase factor sigma-54 [Syntrophomonadaceae bacterium]MDD4549779.1 RNA polymerase factor sigma-54 [Syntrophomonadaceae bacterium]